MNFFLTSTIDAESQPLISRVKALISEELPAQIASTLYFSRLHYLYQQDQLSASNAINLFDFFLETTDVAFKNNTLADFLSFENLTDPKELGTEQKQEGYEVKGYLATYPDGRQAMIRVDAETDQLDSVAFADENGKMLASDVYDYRGFKGVHYVMNPDGSLKQSKYLKPDGTAPLQFMYDSQSTVSRITLSFQNELRIFLNPQGMQTYFLEQLNAKHDETNHFIAEDFKTAPTLASMKSVAKKSVYLHDYVVPVPNQPDQLQLNQNNAYAISNPHEFDSFLIGTDQEKQDLVHRFKIDIPVTVISDQPDHQVTPWLNFLNNK